MLLHNIFPVQRIKPANMPSRLIAIPSIVALIYLLKHRDQAEKARLAAQLNTVMASAGCAPDSVQGHHKIAAQNVYEMMRRCASEAPYPRFYPNHNVDRRVTAAVIKSLMQSGCRIEKSGLLNASADLSVAVARCVESMRQKNAGPKI